MCVLKLENREKQSDEPITRRSSDACQCSIIFTYNFNEIIQQQNWVSGSEKELSLKKDINSRNKKMQISHYLSTMICL
jgi:hypothetical protein